MTREALQFLYSHEGEQLLQKYKNKTIRELELLALTLSKKDVPHAADLVTLLKLRAKAQGKFSKAHQMFFTSEGLEQSSDEHIARYIARRFTKVVPSGSKVTDLTSGVGGNTIFLAEYYKVLAVDYNEVHVVCTRYNAEVYGTDKNIEFVIGKAEDTIHRSSAFLLDPQRIRTGKTKTRSLKNSSPNILRILPRITEITDNVCMKISPAFDYGELCELLGNYELEVISEKNVNKAALLWFGEFKSCDRRATILTGQQSISFAAQKNDKEVSIAPKPLKYIYEPNKAIIKSHLIGKVADKYKLRKINAQTAFLTSNQCLEKVDDIFRIFEVIDFQSFSLKSLKKNLADRKISRAHIIVRRFPAKPEDIRKKLKLQEGGEYVIIITSLADEKHYFILTKGVKS